MTLIRAVIAAAVLILPNWAFAAADETPAAPEPSAAEQVLSATETDRTIAQGSRGESEAYARVQAAPLPPTKPRGRPSKLSVARAAPAQHASWGCSGYWCGRQIVLMLGVGY
jgi:hypothetical protein